MIVMIESFFVELDFYLTLGLLSVEMLFKELLWLCFEEKRFLRSFGSPTGNKVDFFTYIFVFAFALLPKGLLKY